MNSGGATGQTVYDWNPTMQAYWQGTEANPGGYLGVANSEFWKNYGKGYEEYGSDKAVAGLDRNQKRGIDEIYNMSMDPARYAPDTAAGRQQNTDTAQGKYLGANEYAQKQNEFAGFNPYFRQNVQSGLDDMAGAYEKGTAADTRAQMAMSGLLGSSAHTNTVASNQDALAKRMGDYTNQAYSQQFDRSANLEDARLGRASGAYESERGRMLQGAAGGLQGQGLSMDMFNNLINSGGVARQADQQKRDFDWQEYQNKQNYGRNQLDWMGNFLSRAQGGIGGQVNMYGGGGGSGLGSALGTAMMGYGMFRG